MLADKPGPPPESELRLRLAHLVRRYAYAADLSPNALMAAPGSIQVLATTPTSTDVAEQATAYWSASALGCADLQLRAAVDHLRGLAHLLTRSPAVLPAIAVSRSVVEASARAAALARPALGERAASACLRACRRFEGLPSCGRRTSCVVPVVTNCGARRRGGGLDRLHRAISGGLVGAGALPGPMQARSAACRSMSSTPRRLKLATVAAKNACRRVFRRPR